MNDHRWHKIHSGPNSESLTMAMYVGTGVVMKQIEDWQRAGGSVSLCFIPEAIIHESSQGELYIGADNR